MTSEKSMFQSLRPMFSRAVTFGRNRKGLIIGVDMLKSLLSERSRRSPRKTIFCGGLALDTQDQHGDLESTDTLGNQT